MQQLLIWRHAEATFGLPDLEDFARPLTGSGTQQAARMARYIESKLELPEAILCSPARRTRETLAPLLAGNPQLENVTRFVPQMYNAPEEILVSLLDFAFAESDRVLIVGHNPAVGRLSAELTRNSAEKTISAMPPGTLVVVDFDAGWTVGSGPGRLNRRITGFE